MNWDDLKEQLRDKLDELKSQLEDSPAFNTLKEKFETLNPNAQKAIIWSTIVFASLVVFSCPYSYWSESSTYLTEFEDTRATLRDLLRASHMASQTNNLPAALDPSALNSQVQNVLNAARLLPEQKGGVIAADVKQFGAPLAPPDINQTGLEVSLKKLNLKQVVDIGYRLQSLNQAVKLAGFDIAASAENDHYFDVTYRLIQFSLAREEPPPTQNEQPPSRQRPRNQDEG